MKSDSGFSLVELLIAATIMLMIFAVVYTVFIQTRKFALRNQMDTEILQNGRIGLDEMARMLRMIGYHRDRAKGQAALIEAAPFQIIFNADVDANISALPPKSPVHLYDSTNYISPLQNYTTGAETIRWTLDTNDDGVVDAQDTNDDLEERQTAQNFNDMVLNKEVNGKHLTDRQITLGLLGPFDAHDQRTQVTPLFQYWLLGADLNFYLLGDQDGDGRLDRDEQYFRSITSQAILQAVRRIQITVTTESDDRDPINPSQHRRISLSTEVKLRNNPENLPE
jgi:prepilin-type N-terminal cleavage/methylation domain-containing protein